MSIAPSATDADDVTTRAEPSTAVAECASALRELMLASEQFRLVGAAHLGLTVTDSQAVSYLLARGAMEQHELAAAMEMTPGSITSVVDRLVQRGFVERVPHPTDRRRSIVQLSLRGVELLVDARSWLNDAFIDVPADEQAAVARSLRTVAAGLRARAAAVPQRPDNVQERRRRR